MDLNKLINRKDSLFTADLEQHEKELCDYIQSSRFLVLGAAGSIGQAVTKEIFKRNPKCLHAVDLSENNLAELVRDLRSDVGYIQGEFKTFVLDIGSDLFETFIQQQSSYDYVLNLTALKHVRSEKDPFTLMRLTEVNIFNTLKTLNLTKHENLKKYFCVSTDKAAAPANMMGASKRIMELFLLRESQSQEISSARFANVLFSDGSLPYSFTQRLAKQQPIVAPNDIKRYFISKEDSGLLCLFSCLLGENRELFFPKLEEKHLLSFKDIAIDYLQECGYQILECDSEEEARKTPISNKTKTWPCLWTQSDTSGEKEFEEFYLENEELDLNRFKALGIVKPNLSHIPLDRLEQFKQRIQHYKNSSIWSREDLIKCYQDLLPEFNHKETGKFLDNKM